MWLIITSPVLSEMFVLVENWKHEYRYAHTLDYTTHICNPTSIAAKLGKHISESPYDKFIA